MLYAIGPIFLVRIVNLGTRIDDMNGSRARQLKLSRSALFLASESHASSLLFGITSLGYVVRISRRARDRRSRGVGRYLRVKHSPARKSVVDLVLKANRGIGRSEELRDRSS